MANESITGFVQNVSPIRSGPKKNFSDFQLQTESDKSVRAICFSPLKRKLFVGCENDSTPVKICKFTRDNKEDSSDILMGDYIVVKKLETKDVSFPKKDLIAADFNLSMLQTISPQQLVSLKAKLLHLQKEQVINTPQGVLKMAEGLLVDVQGSAKITFWEDDVKKVVAGKTYEFKNLRVKKDKLNGNLYVNPAKGIGSISPCEAFKCDLFIPDYDPSQLMTCTLNKAEIAGVTEVRLDYCCFKCNSHVEEKKITTCENARCKLTQRLDKCKKKWYAKALVTEDDVNVYVVFRDEVLMKALSLSAAIPSTLTKEFIVEKLLLLETIQLTYHSRSKLVESLELTW